MNIEAIQEKAPARETVLVLTAGGTIIIDVLGTEAFWEGTSPEPEDNGVPALLAWLRQLIARGDLVETGSDGMGGLCSITSNAILAMTHIYGSTGPRS